MSEYGWWGQSNHEYEAHDPISPYDRVCGAIYRKGRNSVAGEKCPYKRSDYITVWELGASDAYEEAHPDSVKEWYETEVDWFDEIEVKS